MKAKKYTEEQIIAVLKEGEAGAKVAKSAFLFFCRNAECL